jgi:hypothetical protein
MDPRCLVPVDARRHCCREAGLLRPSVPVIALLHVFGGEWDELVLLVAGVALAVFVVYWTNRGSRSSDDDDEENEVSP